MIPHSDTTLQVRSQRTSHWFWLDNQLIDHHAKHIGPVGVALYAALARYCNNATGQCFPSLGRLGCQLGVTPLTVSRYLQRLVDRHLITVEPRPGHTALITLLDMPRIEEKPAIPAPDAGYISGKDPVSEGTYSVKEGTYLVKTPSLPRKDEPSSLNHPHKEQEKAFAFAGRGKEEKPKPTYPAHDLYGEAASWNKKATLPPMTLEDRLDTHVAALGLTPTEYDNLYVVAKAQLIARGTSLRFGERFTVEAQMVALWQAEKAA
jgi:hypothetical protein